jgi:hypothetical protein
MVAADEASRVNAAKLDHRAYQHDQQQAHPLGTLDELCALAVK